MAIIRQCREDEQPEVLAIINSAAQRYRGVIPDDHWHDPYMSSEQLDRELAAGVELWGYELDGLLVGLMGIQRVLDVDLIRHAYVAPPFQGRSIGTELIARLCAQGKRTVLVGTWMAATWAIGFYQRNGFKLVDRDEASRLMRKYWTISGPQIEASVVLRQA